MRVSDAVGTAPGRPLRRAIDVSGTTQRSEASSRAQPSFCPCIYISGSSTVGLPEYPRMRIELAELHAKLHANGVYVPRDQGEAETMADQTVMCGPAASKAILHNER